MILKIDNFPRILKIPDLPKLNYSYSELNYKIIPQTNANDFSSFQNSSGNDFKIIEDSFFLDSKNIKLI